MLSSVIRHLVHRDILSLRATCRTLRSSLASSYPKLVITCQSMYPFKTHGHAGSKPPLEATRWKLSGHPRERCTSGSEWKGEVRLCRGKGLGIATFPHFQHDNNYWICKPCHEVALGPQVRRPRMFGVQQSFYGQLNAGALAPICFDCVKKRGWPDEDKLPDARDSSDPYRPPCDCVYDFENKVREDWLCYDCAHLLWWEEFRIPIKKRIAELRALNERLNHGIPRAEHRYVCGRCEKPYGKTRMYDYGMPLAGLSAHFWMCVRCEDLYTTPGLPKMRIIDI